MELHMPQPEQASDDPSHSPNLNYKTSPQLHSQLTSNDHIASYECRSRNPTTSPPTHADKYQPPQIGDMTNATDPPKDPKENNAMGQDTASGLGDDGYELLSDSTVLHSEGDAETVSSFSLDGPTGDDVVSVAGSNHSGDSNASDGSDEDEAAADTQDEPVFQPSDSGMTARPNILSPSASMSNGQLAPEEISFNQKGFNVMSPLNYLDESNTPGIRNKYGVEKLTVTLKYGMSLKNLTCGPSRFSVVPISFGDEKPEVQLIESTDFNLILDECFAAEHLHASGTGDLTRLTLSDGRHLDIPANKSPVPFLPNLAVMSYGVQNVNKKEIKDMTAFREAMKDRGVPVLDIVESAEFNMYYPFFLEHDKKSLGVYYQRPDTEVISELPVDLDIFMQLDAERLNRHLACIGIRQTTVEEAVLAFKTAQRAAKRDRVFNKRKVADVIQNLWNQLSLRHLLVCLSTIIVSLMLMQMANNMFQPHPVDLASQRVALNSAIEAFKVAKSGAPSSLVSPGSTVPLVSEMKPVTDVMAPKDNANSLGLPLVHPYSSKGNESEEFKAHIIGDCHFVLTPPKKLTTMRKPPKLSIRIQRGAEEVSHEGEPLVDGVYAVSLERKDAYGTLNVTVTTLSKPRMQQSVEVDFGSSWLQKLGYDKTASKALSKIKTDVSIAQYNAMNTSLQLYTGLQRVCDSVNGAITNAQEKFHKSLEAAAVATHRQAEACRKKASEVKTALFEAASRMDISRAWKKTPAINEAKSVKRAHKNAANIATKVGKMVAGVRSKTAARLFGKKTKKELRTEGKGAKPCKERKGKKSCQS
ncbi:uncharacterized protein K452DRAFT_50398 [Aplosporella prunicola CBS 121167]|uniref:Uncharacterized protein n=1 Tax=Aplosporella prunicola CBS 121167 TaxID=1176127 RepID=A0A6A6BBH4_9PEZI|nr:uncharacterized protein K452DRAFT_50398 [Aplosporella prunicola CBS 121167]KAF2140713.1 hypothetical protein K452DRAFT_50398 [Aplosporella prunicola CBS 121167]